MNTITVTVEKNELGGYSAYAQGHSIFTAADTLPELKVNILEAANLHFEDEGRVITEADIKLDFDLAAFFQNYAMLNAKTLAKHIGMSNTLLSQYVNGSKKPSPKQKNKILEGIRAVGRELQELNFA